MGTISCRSSRTIDPLAQAFQAALAGGLHRSVGRRRPQEPPLFEPFGEQAQALAVAPKALDEIAPATAEDEQMAAVRVALQRLLDDQRQPIEALTLMWSST